ncbi:MAG TPA: hypothetical protein VF540_12150 [Segetibacter sp.]
MLEDIEVSYLGVKVKVTHSLCKPSPLVPGRIRYTFHLPTREVILYYLKNDNDEEVWVEIPNKRTALASELGRVYEKYFEE